MSKKLEYYTWASVSYGRILYRGYEVSEEGIKTRVQGRVDYAPTLYLESKKEDSVYKSLIGSRPLVPKKFDSIPKARQYIKDYGDVMEIYGYAPSRMEYNFLVENFPRELEIGVSDICVGSIDIETTTDHGKIDTIYTPEEITLITYQNVKSKEIVTWGSRPSKTPSYVFCPDEATLLLSFIDHVSKDDPDVLTGWNCVPLTNSVWFHDKIGKMSDIVCGDRLYDSYVEHVFPVSKKNEMELCLVNGAKTSASAEHRFPIKYSPKGKYIDPKNKKLIQKVETLENIESMLEFNEVFVEIPLRKNNNLDLTYRNLLKNNLKSLTDFGASIFIRDTEIVRKRTLVEGSCWRLLKQEDWSIEKITEILGLGEVLSFLDRNTVVDLWNRNFNQSKITLNLDDTISADFLWLAGMWFTDGTSSFHTEVSICNKNIDVAKRSFDILKQYSHNKEKCFKIGSRAKDGCYYVDAGLTQVWFFKYFIYAAATAKSAKKLNVGVLSQLSSDQFLSFFAGCVDGDGSVSRGVVSLCNYNGAIPDFSELLFWNGIFNSQSKNSIRCKLRENSFIDNLTIESKRIDYFSNQFNDSYFGSTYSKCIRWMIDGDVVLVKINSINRTEKIIDMVDISTNTKYFVSNSVKTHNCSKFDIPYLINRGIKIVGQTAVNRLSPFGIIDVKDENVRGKNTQKFTIVGRCILDMLDLYKKFNLTKRENYRLDTISKIELGAGKLENPLKTFREFYSGEFDVLEEPDDDAHEFIKLGYQRTLVKGVDLNAYLALDSEIKGKCWDLFCQYNQIDVIRVSELEDKLGLVALSLSVAYKAWVNYDDVYGPVKIWECLIMGTLYRENTFVTTKRQESHSDGIIGGYVANPTPGFYDWLVSIDAEALYPSCVISMNMSPETLVEMRGDLSDVEFMEYSKEGALNPVQQTAIDSAIHVSQRKNLTLAANGSMYSKEKQGIIPRLMQGLKDSRSLSKKQMIEAKQRALDIREELEKRGVTIDE